MSNPTPVIDITDDLPTFLARTNQFGEANIDLVQQKFNKKQADGAAAPVFAALSSRSRSVAQWPNMFDDHILAFYTAQVGAKTPVDGTVVDSLRRWSGTAWVEETGVRVGTGGSLDVDGVALFDSGAVGTPSISFTDDPDTGIINNSPNNVGIVTGGALRWRVGGGGDLVPNITDSVDLGTASQRIANAVTQNVHGGGATLTVGQAGFRVAVPGIMDRSTTAGITASTTQTQGNGPLTTNINQVNTANANDVVTLPVAVAGREIFVINDAPNTIQIFPASGDDLGAGVDTAVTLAAAGRTRFTAYNSTNWIESP